jgi:hypothetical protein
MLGVVACGGDDDRGGSTTTQGGASSSAGSPAHAGSLALAGTSGSGGSSSATAGKGGGETGGAGSGSGGSSSQGGQGGTGFLQPESAGIISATIDGQKYDFDQTRVSRFGDGQYSIDGRFKAGGNQHIGLELSLFSGLGEYDCVNNMLSYSNVMGETAHAVSTEGSCSINVTAMPNAKGEPFKATFSGTLIGTGVTVSVTGGNADLIAKY